MLKEVGSNASEWGESRFTWYLTAYDRLQDALRQSLAIALLVPAVVRALPESAIRAAVAGVASALDAEELMTDLLPFAERQASHGFPAALDQLIVSTWDALEVYAEGLMTGALLHDSQLRQREVIRRVTISAADFEALDAEARARHLAQRLRQETRTPLRDGVGQIEDALTIVGLAGPVDDEVRSQLVQAHHLRDVLLHRAGAADQRLAEHWPELRLRRGDRVRVTLPMAFRYHIAALHYGASIRKRCHQWELARLAQAVADLEAIIAERPTAPPARP